MRKIAKLRDLFLLFIFFAVCGWVYEVLLTLWAYGYFENRGFLFGAWLPIYGFGGLALYMMFGRLCRLHTTRGKAAVRILLIFVSICVAATVLELAASYLLDLAGVGFSSLWNYYEEPLNFDGRIGLISTLRFGVIGTAALYLAVPLWERFVGMKDQKAVNITCVVLLILFVTDLAARIPFGSNL